MLLPLPGGGVLDCWVVYPAGYDAAKLTDGITGWEEEGLALEPEGGYVAESGEAAAVIEARKKAAQS